MEPGSPVVEAMVIRGDTIVATGGRRELEEKYTEAQLHDLQGSIVLPGIIDSHTHVRSLGLNQIKPDLEETNTVAEMVEVMKTFYQSPEPGMWLIGRGWDEGAWASRGYPDRKLLDEAFPENPVKLEALHGFAGFYNSKALEAAGLPESQPEEFAASILKRADGTLTGILLSSAQGLVDSYIPEPSTADIKAALQLGLRLMAEVGVTSVHEFGLNAITIQVLQELAEANLLPIRVYGLLDGSDNALMQEWYRRGPLHDEDGFLAVKGVKIFYDGSLGSRTALLREPFSDNPDAQMDERITVDRLSRISELASEAKLQMAIHAIGDEANHRTLEAFEHALQAHPNPDHRWRIEQAQTVLPDFYTRAKRMNVIASMQSSHAVLDSPWAEDRVGPQRIRHSYAWRNMLDAGVKLIINSDLPAVPWAAMQTLHFAVNRAPLEKPNEGWYTDQVLTIEEALKAMTIDGAYAAFQENLIGSLKSGKFADFIEISDDPFTINKLDLQNIKVLRTWVGGTVVTENKN